jgi:hypothetical protein
LVRHLLATLRASEASAPVIFASFAGHAVPVAA